MVDDQPPPGIPSVAFDDFAALCTKASTIAADRARPVVVSWTFAVPHLTVADRVRHISARNGRTFVWASSWTGLRRLAVGTALDLTAQGQDRFAQLSQVWSRCRDGALVGGTFRGPALVGGFRFGGGTNLDGALPDALMWLPAAELTEAPGSAPEVTLNACIGSATGVGPAIRRARRAVRTMLRDSGVGGKQRPQLLSLRETPSAFDWRQLVRRALAEIELGSFDKVVLARQMAVDFDRPVAIAPLVGSLIEEHRTGAVFGAQLGGRWFVGRTPECLMHLDGERAETHGLAGSLPRDPDPVRDGQLCDNLLTDPKLEREHAIVADYIKATLREQFRDVRTNIASPVLKLADIQHLQTGISARKPISAPDLLSLAGALHPTPAVGGFPTAPALRWLTENEPFERDWYAAPIGWVGADGGELAVGIRSALISGQSAVVYAGCGIVQGSDPEDEYEETCVKMRQMLVVLGVDLHEMAA
ncbi:MAG: menaquinone-specific isochorismate synthase [Mycobacterium sp.]|nr:menaquinone-specific isochorismate synthase [Mycobacterium sp.]